MQNQQWQLVNMFLKTNTGFTKNAQTGKGSVLTWKH